MPRFLTFAAIAILIWGLYPLYVTFFGDEFILILVFAQVIAFALWVGVLWLCGVKRVFVWQLRKPMRRAAALSGVGNAVEYLAFFVALKFSNPVIPTALFELWIVFLVLLDFLFWRTPLSRKNFFLLCVAFVGAAMCIINPASLTTTFRIENQWALLALVAALAMALKTSMNNALSLRLRKPGGRRMFHEPKSVAPGSRRLGFAASLLPHTYAAQYSFVVYLLVVGAFYIPGSPLQFEGFGALFSISASTWLMAAGLGLGIIGIGGPVFIYAMSIRPENSSAAIFYFIPVVAVLSIALVYNEPLTYYFSFGIGLIIAASYLISLNAASLNATMIAALSALIFGYLVVFLDGQFSGFAPREDIFIFEASFLVFGLIIVFAIERTNQVRTTHQQRFVEFGNALVDAVRRNGWSADDAVSIQEKVVRLDMSQDPIGRLETEHELISQIRSLPAKAEEKVDLLVNALQKWLVIKMSFFPRSHHLLVILFSVALIAQLIAFSVSAARPVAFFSLMLCAVIVYLVAFLWELSHPYSSRHAATHLLHQRVLSIFPLETIRRQEGVEIISIKGLSFPVATVTARNVADKVAYSKRLTDRYAGIILMVLSLLLSLYWIMQ